MTNKDLERLYGNFISDTRTWQHHTNKASTLHDAGSQFDSALFGAGALVANKNSPIGGTLDMLAQITDSTYRKYRKDKRITARSGAHRRAQAHELAAQEAGQRAKASIDAIKNEYSTRVKQNAAANYKYDNYNSQLFR